MNNFKIGDIIKGEVTGVTKYGVFVNLDYDYTGLVHISEVSDKYVKDLKERFMIGDVIRAKVLDIDESTNHIKLSIKEINCKAEREETKIEESGLGFELLEENMPKWIEDKMKEMA